MNSRDELNTICSIKITERLGLLSVIRGGNSTGVAYFSLHFCTVFTQIFALSFINLKRWCTPMISSMVSGHCIFQEICYFHKTTVKQAEFDIFGDEPGCLAVRSNSVH